MSYDAKIRAAKVASVIGWKNGKPACLGYLSPIGDWLGAFSSGACEGWPLYGPGGRCLGAAADPDQAARLVVSRWAGCGYT